MAGRGHYEEFTLKFEQLFPPDAICRKVFISDGAIWLSKWFKQTYADATHILDYYHLKEKLAAAAQQPLRANTGCRSRKTTFLPAGKRLLKRR